jgi:TolB-like protein/Tfp pilus assembly protein PilF
VYTLLSEPPKGLWQAVRVQRLKLKRWGWVVQVAAIMGLVVWAGAITVKSFRPAPSPGPLQGGAPPDSQRGLPLPDKPSIAILPFVNMSGDSGQEYFSDGITESLTAGLSRLSGLFVISRNSAFTYKGKAVKVQEVSQELGVRYVLEGSVLKAGERVRITAQLIDATQDRHLWSEQYDRELKDIFSLQDEIVQKIVTTLKLQLSLWEQGKGVYGSPRTNNLEAYDSFLRGAESYLRFTKEANAQARQLFERAVALDPQYAGAYAFLDWYWLTLGVAYRLAGRYEEAIAAQQQALSRNPASPGPYAELALGYGEQWLFQLSQDPQTMEQATEMAQKEVALNDSFPYAHTVLGLIYLWNKQPEQAIAEAERAIALNPNAGDGYIGLAHILNATGRPQEAIAAVEKGLRCPSRFSNWWHVIELGTAYYLTGQYEEARATLGQVANRSLNYPWLHLLLAATYGQLGREQEAQAEAAEILRLSPAFSLEVAKQRLPFTDPAALEHFFADLRKAGLK